MISGTFFKWVAADLLQTKWWLIESRHNDGILNCPQVTWSLIIIVWWWGVRRPPHKKTMDDALHLKKCAWRQKDLFFGPEIFRTKLPRDDFLLRRFNGYRRPRKTSRGEAVGFSRARKFQSRKIWCQKLRHDFISWADNLNAKFPIIIKDVRFFLGHVLTGSCKPDILYTCLDTRQLPIQMIAIWGPTQHSPKLVGIVK